MKITCLCVSKTDNKNLEILIDEYIKRINKFVKFQMEYISAPKNIGKLQAHDVKRAEGELILKRTENADLMVLLDEKGKAYSSVKFAAQIQRYFNSGPKHLVFVVGGAFGFSDAVYKKANDLLSLSTMTTTHQLIRLLFTEQIYRAFTILKGHPYHNQ